jgi:hypothetical protein
VPKLTRWSLKAAMAYLVVALLLSATDAARPLSEALPMGAPPKVSGPLIVHLLVVGWLTQLIFGVAYWMFPTYSKSAPYRSERLAWFMFATLNLGLMARAGAELAAPRLPDTGLPGLFAAAALLQWLAGVAFVVNTWARVRPHHARKE